MLTMQWYHCTIECFGRSVDVCIYCANWLFGCNVAVFPHCTTGCFRCNVTVCMNAAIKYVGCHVAGCVHCIVGMFVEIK